MSSTVSFAYVDEAWGDACAPTFEKKRKSRKMVEAEKNQNINAKQGRGDSLPKVYDDIMDTYMQPCSVDDEEQDVGNSCYGPLLPPRKPQPAASVQKCRQFDPSYNDLPLLDASEMPYHRFHRDDNMFYNGVAEESRSQSQSLVLDETYDTTHALEEQHPQYVVPATVSTAGPSSRVYTQAQVFDLIAYLLSGILLIVILEQILRIGMALRFS